MAAAKVDPRVDKRRVEMSSVQKLPTGEIVEMKGVDYVRPDHLDAYVADAKTRWQAVTVSEEPDAGPGGYDGQTHVPAALAVSDAGTTYAATEG